MFCAKCGHQLDDQAAFCSACGAAASGAAASPEGQPMQPLPPMNVAQHPQPEPPPFPVGQPNVPPLPYAPAPAYGAQPAGRSRPWVWIVVAAAGVVAIAGLAIGGVMLYEARTKVPTSAASSSGNEPGSVSLAPSSTSSIEPSATSEVPTVSSVVTQPPQTPATTKAQSAPAPVSLTKASAIHLVTTYLSDAKAGRRSKAKAVVTQHYLDQITSDYYSLAATDLRKFQVLGAESRDNGYAVTVKETWDSGVWTNWYQVLLKNGKLVIDFTGTE